MVFRNLRKFWLSLIPPNPKTQSAFLHGLLLLFWIAIGAVLRFTNLDSKPVWADEWSTIVFSLGHSFRTVPLDRVISIDTLLSGMNLDRTTEPTDVIKHLMSESTHPPIYFVLTHLWLKLLSAKSGLVSVGLARSLSALLGVASIPAMFGLGWLVFRSPIDGQMAAALMAVSPYGVYLAQEARHYTLSILWVIASLGCFLVAVRRIQRRIPLPFWLVCVWIIVNSLGIASHYFFVFVLIVQMLILGKFWLSGLQLKLRQKSLNPSLSSSHWLKIYTVIAGTLVGGSIWLSAWLSIPNHKLTEWIYHGNPLGSQFLEPFGRLVVWLITMLFLLPVEGMPLLVTIASGLVLLLVLIWLTPTVIRSLRLQLQKSSTRLMTRVLGEFVLGAIALFLIVTYTTGIDLTLAARYQFVYFPAVLVLMGMVLSQTWQESTAKRSPSVASNHSFFNAKGKRVVAITLIIGLLGGLTVVNNLGYQKADRPDLVVPVMVEAYNLAPKTPVLMANVHKTHEQTGEMMGLAWEFEQIARRLEPLDSKVFLNSFKFLLAHKEEDAEIATQTLQKILTELPRPLELWVVNFSAPTHQLGNYQCEADTNFKRRASGYYYRLYHCLD
ncbi:hypothetical protein IQ238_16810 [Pleurocapsales cyanobacterium LEGE 06147]|nr:hypothetical protein [Pleurocapsales cyanobacterium LEGE 06147]